MLFEKEEEEHPYYNEKCAHLKYVISRLVEIHDGGRLPGRSEDAPIELLEFQEYLNAKLRIDYVCLTDELMNFKRRLDSKLDEEIAIVEKEINEREIRMIITKKEEEEKKREAQTMIAKKKKDEKEMELRMIIANKENEEANNIEWYRKLKLTIFAEVFPAVTAILAGILYALYHK